MGERGFEVWRVLKGHYDPQGKQTAQALLEALQDIKWPKSPDDVESFIQKLELDLEKYESLTSRKDDKVSLRIKLVSILPQELKTHINHN